MEDKPVASACYQPLFVNSGLVRTTAKPAALPLYFDVVHPRGVFDTVLPFHFGSLSHCLLLSYLF